MHTHIHTTPEGQANGQRFAVCRRFGLSCESTELNGALLRLHTRAYMECHTTHLQGPGKVKPSQIRVRTALSHDCRSPGVTSGSNRRERRQETSAGREPEYECVIYLDMRDLTCCVRAKHGSDYQSPTAPLRTRAIISRGEELVMSLMWRHARFQLYWPSVKPWHAHVAIHKRTCAMA